MADLSSSIFNKKATEKLRSPEDLDKYVKVTSPSIWVALGACIILLIGLAAWGFFGAVTTNLTTKGILVDADTGTTVCFISISEINEVHTGDIATINGMEFTVESFSPMPLSRAEVSAMLNSDYLTELLLEDEWVYQVNFDGPYDQLWEGVPFDVSIQVDSVPPVSLILGNSGA